MHANLTRTCLECGTPFTARKPSSKQRYCSPACGYAAQSRAQDQQVEASCEWCGEVFRAGRTRITIRRYCSRPCMRAAQAAERMAQFPDRFWEKVDKSGGPESCWPWTGSKNSGTGYGRVRVNGVFQGTHRVAWELANDRPLGDLIACHHCDNPICCNPSHLFAGTHRDNARDKVAKKRMVRRCDRMNETLAAEIRERYAAGSTTYPELAHEYGVSSDCIGNIVRHQTWKD